MLHAKLAYCRHALVFTTLPINTLLYFGALVFMGIRAFAEDRVLKQDPAYAEVVARVPHRIIPFLF